MPEGLEFEDRAAPNPEARLQAGELYAAIATLPDDFRDALVAIDVVGLSYREAARALHVREATITTRLYRARQRLAKELTPQESRAPDRRQ
jgi:RNA polymerase sigma-70 factor (ECF subfamily)